MMKLTAGDRYLLTNENSFAMVTSGKVEVYAATRRKISFRQIYLMEIGEGGAAFPSMDQFDEIDIVLYAVEDTEIEEYSFETVPTKILTPLMRSWFAELIKLSWLRLLADRGDDTLLTWLDGSVLKGADSDNQSLIEAFADNEGIFAMLLGVRYKSENVKLAHRMEAREKNKQRIIEETISTLLDEDTTPLDEESSGNEKLEEAAFIVRCIAKALSMPAGDVHIAPEMVKKLDQLNIIRRLAQKGGIQLRLIRLESDWYTGDSGVMLGYYGDNKVLAALIPETTTSYRLITQSNPKGIKVTEEVAEKVDTDAFYCYAELPSRKLNISDLMQFVLRQSWKSDWRTILFASLVAGIIPLVTPIITETIFQDIIPILDREGLATVTQVAMVTGFTTATLTIVRSVAQLRFSLRADMSIESAVFARILSLPTGFFRKVQAGDLASRLQGLSMIQPLISGEMTGTILNFLFSFWSLLLMCYYSLKFTGIAILIWLAYLVIILLITRRLINFQERMTEVQNKTAGLLQQIFTGLAKFRLRGAESQAYKLWGQQFAKEWQLNYKVRWQQNYSTIINAVQPILLSLALYYVAFKDITEAMTSGKTEDVMTFASFLAFQAAYTAFNTSMVMTIPAIEQLLIIRPIFKNLKPILEAEPETAEDKMEADVLSGNLEVRHLTFNYGEGLPNVLNDLSFKIAAGESVAIVGRSGCGKSTLIRLLLGFETPKSGAIYYDDQDLSELSLPSVRMQLGVVLQSGQLMTGDIFRNIIGMNNLTLDEAWAAAKAAGVDEDIRQMPMGMQTVISEGSSNISGGQRQRILIARALAMKPSILIFDEATSALDNRTQAIVTESIDKLKVTRIVIAHRLSTIRNVDRIIVLDGGTIAESGTFDELVAKGGIFAGFVKRQVA